MNLPVPMILFLIGLLLRNPVIIVISIFVWIPMHFIFWDILDDIDDQGH